MPLRKLEHRFILRMVGQMQNENEHENAHEQQNENGKVGAEETSPSLVCLLLDDLGRLDRGCGRHGVQNITSIECWRNSGRFELLNLSPNLGVRQAR